MSRRTPTHPLIEPERYELQPWLVDDWTISRREFLQGLGGGILILLTLSDAATAQESGGRRGRGGRRGFGAPAPAEISAWLHIGEDGTVTAYTGKTEVGQNIRTSLTQAVAEELRVPIDRVRLVMADTELTPFDMGTFGSRTTPTMAPQLHKAAAAARELLIDMAAERWKTDRAPLTVAGGRVTDPKTKESLGFGELTQGQKLVKAIAADTPTTPAPEWKIAGQSAPKVDGRAIVTGKHAYSTDIRRPGMRVGKILRPPAFNAKLISVDTHAAEAMPEVTVVHEDSFVGVTAPNEQIAAKALAALRPDWQTTPQPSSAELFSLLKKPSSEGRNSGPPQTQGSVAEGLAAAQRKLSATYTVAYIAHAPLEPRAAVAEWSGDKLTVWTGTQRPFGVRSELAGALQMPEEKIRVIVPDTGSGYGGKHTGEAAVEAARLAKATGKPVRVVWTREEEFTWAYFRPAGVIEINSGVQSDGMLVAWEFHNYNSGGSGIQTPYEVAHQQVAFHGSDSPLRQGSYRGLAATANHFARECHMDELAHALAIDPLEFRRRNLKEPRLRAVLEAAADRFGWSQRRKTAGRGFGLACGTEKGSYVATCAEVAADRAAGRLKIVRLVTAFECGAVVNPEHLKNQIEGAALMGIGGALREAIEFENGAITNPHFAQYRVPRFSDMPAMETVLVDRKDLPSAGAGETPIVCVAPAIGNAIFDATGTRLRSMPMTPNGLKT
jgi:CO/xanthine dehydrogenase Mo-binding subunit